MTLSGKIVSVVGSDPKAGTSMIARSLAECLAKETGEAVLYLKNGEGGSRIAPWNEAEMTLAEAGLTRYLSLPAEEAYRELRARFLFTVTDTGPEAVRDADRLIFVVNQLSSSVRAAEKTEAELRRRFAENRPDEAEKRILCLNRFLPGDPFDVACLKTVLPEWNALTVPESPRGREADWEDVTILKLGDRPYRKAVREVVKWILNN